MKLNNTLKRFSNEDLNTIKNAVYKISDAYQMLKSIDNKKAYNGDLNKLIYDLEEIGIKSENGGALDYFLRVL